MTGKLMSIAEAQEWVRRLEEGKIVGTVAHRACRTILALAAMLQHRNLRHETNCPVCIKDEALLRQYLCCEDTMDDGLFRVQARGQDMQRQANGRTGNIRRRSRRRAQGAQTKKRKPWNKGLRMIYCGECDGCGWVEGGETLQTTCQYCEGRGKIWPFPYSDYSLQRKGREG